MLGLLKRRLRRYDIDSLENRDEGLIAAAVGFVEQTLGRYHRAEVRGVERIPPGAALYVGNHNSYTYTPDTYLFAAAAYRKHGIEAVPFGLAHEVIFSFPVVNQFLAPLGAVRASHQNGERLLGSGRKVLVYPGGDLDALRPYRHRNRIVFGGRRGYVRLALRAGVPIVPVVAAGAHATLLVLDDLRPLARAIGAERYLRTKVWPLSLSFPWGLTLGPPPPWLPYPARILMEVLPPVRFERTGPAAAADEAWVARCADAVERAMQAALTRLAIERDGASRERSRGS
ncbi:MAG: acyltransferase family protein [Myxococcales bacterium]|nr:acyltransferase family protein [Myxococcales bacterium]